MTMMAAVVVYCSNARQQTLKFLVLVMHK